VSHKGQFYTVNDAGISAKPVRPGGPLLYIAGQADVSVRRAARIDDAWLIVNTSGLGKVKPLMQTYRAARGLQDRTTQGSSACNRFIIRDNVSAQGGDRALS
jgi:alkanesulfonate monooxygenase SsuD/methylene tetrahydromethanopterin reductase-like flavin-dependent oxidoreductase (luciferase family)